MWREYSVSFFTKSSAIFSKKKRDNNKHNTSSLSFEATPSKKLVNKTQERASHLQHSTLQFQCCQASRWSCSPNAFFFVESLALGIPAVWRRAVARTQRGLCWISTVSKPLKSWKDRVGARL